MFFHDNETVHPVITRKLSGGKMQFYFRHFCKMNVFFFSSLLLQLQLFIFFLINSISRLCCIIHLCSSLVQRFPFTHLHSISQKLLPLLSRLLPSFYLSSCLFLHLLSLFLPNLFFSTTFCQFPLCFSSFTSSLIFSTCDYGKSAEQRQHTWPPLPHPPPTPTLLLSNVMSCDRLQPPAIMLPLPLMLGDSH